MEMIRSMCIFLLYLCIFKTITRRNIVKLERVFELTYNELCLVMPFVAADGTLLQMSSNHRLSYMKNGSVYDIDQGVEPNYVIHQPEHFYDRQALTEYINNLY